MDKPSVFFLAIGLALICLALGVWQWQRLAWKEGLIAQINQQCALAEPSPLPPFDDITPHQNQDWLWRQVRLEGAWLDETFFLWSRGTWHHIQLARLNKGGLIFIDRGTKPPPKADEDRSLLMTATLYPSSPPRFFDGQNDFFRKRLYRPDIEALADHLRLDSLFPFLAKIGKQCPLLRNHHLGYALTWWSLMIAIPLIFFLARARKRA